MKTRKREAIACAAGLLLLLAMLGLLTRLLTPKQHEMGSTWGQFLQEPEHSLDVMFFGSSLVYCDVAPAVFWEETGLASYVMAGPEQAMPMTYYYVKEALATQSPQAIFVELTGMFYARYTSYTKTNIGQMPWGINRLSATFREAEPELRAGLLFPLLFYHDRWSGLSADDFRVTFSGYDADPLAGYTYLDTYCTPSAVSDRKIVADADNQSRNWDALCRIHQLCADEGITLVLYVAPVLERIPHSLMEPLQERIRTELDGALLLDCNAVFDEIGVELSQDFHDTLHFNVSGAEQFSRFLGQWTENNLELTPQAGQDAALWQGRARHFAALASQPLQPVPDGT